MTHVMCVIHFLVQRHLDMTLEPSDYWMMSSARPLIPLYLCLYHHRQDCLSVAPEKMCHITIVRFNVQAHQSRLVIY